MGAKKEILEWVKSIAEHQDLIATRHNTDRKAEAIATQTILAEILRELKQINNLIKGAAEQPADAVVDNPKLVPEVTESINTVYADEIFKDDWVTGPEVAKMIGWKTCNVRMLRSAGISFIQAGKGRNLKIYLPDVSKYIQKRDNKKNKAK